MLGKQPTTLNGEEFRRNLRTSTILSIAKSPEELKSSLIEVLGDSQKVKQLLSDAYNLVDGSVGENDFTEEEEFSNEQLQIIKAKTMYQMVEEVDDGKCKLLFLTNPQAELIASSPESVQKMLDALEVPKPSLVIEMLQSWGFRASTTVDGVPVDLPLDWDAASGIISGRPPFLCHEDEREAEAKIDMFMADVIIPLAAETQAIVLCDAIPGEDILSTSFLRMYSLMKSKWSGPPPFTVLSSTNVMQCLYANPNEKAYWHTVRDASISWKARDKKLKEIFGTGAKAKTGTRMAGTRMKNHDLDPNAACVILVDSINPKTNAADRKPFAALKQALVRHLSNSVPSLCLKTGFSSKERLGSSSKKSLDIVSARAQSGTPVLALDVRRRAPGKKSWNRITDEIDEKKKEILHRKAQRLDRKQRNRRNARQRNSIINGRIRSNSGISCPTLPCMKADADSEIGESDTLETSANEQKEITEFLREKRQELIDEAKTEIEKWHNELLDSKTPVAETLDMCTLAYLHEVVTGDGTLYTHALENSKFIPLYKAIAVAKGHDSTETNTNALPPSNQEQVASISRWLSSRIFFDAWFVRNNFKREFDHRAKKTNVIDGGNDSEHKSEASPEGQIMTITEKVGEKSIWASGVPDDLVVAQEVHFRTLLSSPNFYHANLSDMENAQKLVNQIVRLDRLPPSNPLEGLLLLRDAWKDYDVAMLLADRYKIWCKLIFSAQLLFSWLIVCGSTTYMTETTEGNVVHFVFGVSVAFSILVCLDGLLSPKARWRHLRSSASLLQSIVWKYRTRTGAFEVDSSRSMSTSPESVLCNLLNEWRANLLAGASLKATNLTRQYPPHVYKHFQDFYKRDPELDDDLFDDDDHQSPTQPNRYIVLRIEPMMKFYTRRVPIYVQHGFFFKILIILLGVTASVLARYEELTWVTTVTAAATVVTSWAEFSEDLRKIERYSSAITSLKCLLSWWDSLGDVQKASRESIAQLVLDAESIISNEQSSWTSTANTNGGNGDNNASDPDATSDDKKDISQNSLSSPI